MKFKESRIAHKYLDGLTGIEIGGSAHNPFGLNTKNVDYTDQVTRFKEEEVENCGEYLPVDIIANGDNLPLKDKEVDFVISSHVIEHFFDPIKAIKEWVRVSKRYVLIIAPHKERTFDRDRPVTPLQELIDRHSGKIPTPETDTHEHYSVWDTPAFIELIEYLKLPIAAYLDVDDKVGNGFCVVIGDFQNENSRP